MFVDPKTNPYTSVWCVSTNFTKCAQRELGSQHHIQHTANVWDKRLHVWCQGRWCLPIANTLSLLKYGPVSYNKALGGPGMPHKWYINSERMTTLLYNCALMHGNLSTSEIRDNMHPLQTPHFLCQGAYYILLCVIQQPAQENTHSASHCVARRHCLNAHYFLCKKVPVVLT